MWAGAKEAIFPTARFNNKINVKCGKRAKKDHFPKIHLPSVFSAGSEPYKKMIDHHQGQAVTRSRPFQGPCPRAHLPDNRTNTPSNI